MELEALRVSLTTVYTSQLEASQASEQQAEVISKLKASMKETFTQERAILQAQHESDLEKLKQENQEQQDRLQKQHQLEMGTYIQTKTPLCQCFHSGIYF